MSSDTEQFQEHIQDVCEALGWDVEARYDTDGGEQMFQADLLKHIEEQAERIKELEGKSMKLRNGDIVSELEYYRLRFPKMVKAAKEASRLLNDRSDY